MGGFAGFLTSLGVPAPGVFAFLVTALEVGGGLLLILGLGTRWVSLLFVIEMLVTILLVKLPNAGFIAPQGGGVCIAAAGRVRESKSTQ